ncbi:hypothetical protein HPB47_012456 [Ixodes persulcatus]|uniref:Uncharacterized protein n=1 Tax=Ixodes persulcatus TaxID=34615 RepID=A0AC60NTL1_IXOPE|nr:hypothetical protein HPB47_012456 [Ixodes persulcatus]
MSGWLSQFFAPCTNSDSQSCHLLDQFSVWSRFLSASDMELLGTAPETLSLLCLPYPPTGVIPKNYGPIECILLHWLLKEYCCITHVKVPQIAMFPRFPWNVCFDTLHLNSGLQKLTIDCMTSREQLTMVVLALSSLTDLQELYLSEDVAVLSALSLCSGAREFGAPFTKRTGVPPETDTRARSSCTENFLERELILTGLRPRRLTEFPGAFRGHTSKSGSRAKVVCCLARGAPKGPNLPRARLNHQDALSLDTGSPRTARRQLREYAG